MHFDIHYALDAAIISFDISLRRIFIITPLRHYFRCIFMLISRR